ncbi:hypothetical protein [Nocardioides rubriscoriae]|uniref:hypothetical protein n=1 Tax=Nocardioides rubriscoriae TaxID=642762 RepID=UPI0011E02C34|nr:hypothetical protein [Nocardioides rubriscoriae]
MVTRLGTGASHLVVAGILGLGTGAAAVTVLHLHPADVVARAQPPAGASDRLDEALAALRADGVYVAPDGRSMVDADGEQAIVDAVAANPVPVYVVVWSPDYEIGLNRYTVEDVLQRELGDDDGFAFVWEGAGQGAVLALGPRGGSPDYSTASDFVGDPATSLVDAVSSVSADDFYTYDDDTDGDYWGGPVGGSLAGLLLASAIVGGVLLLSRILAFALGRRRLLPGGWTTRGDTS